MQVRAGAREEAQQQIHQARFGRQLLLRTTEITPNPRNPRRTYNADGLNQLAESMKRDGQIHPVVVRRVGDAWQLVVGERRWRAAQLAGLDQLAAVEREASDDVAFRLAVIENLHREDLSHQEQVEALDTLTELVSGTGLRRAASELNMSPGWLSRRLAMRRDATIFPALEDGRITFTLANELLAAPTTTRSELLNRVVNEPHPVQQMELREWVTEARQMSRRKQRSDEADDLLPDASGPVANAVYARLLEELRAAPDPTTTSEVEALRAIAEQAKLVLRRIRPRSLAAVS
jgi:ParB family chromosome partitioning protein